MTSTMYMETVSLNDDAPDASFAPSNSAVLDMDSLENHFASSSEMTPLTDATASLDSRQEIVVPVSDSDTDEDGKHKETNIKVTKSFADQVKTNSVVVEVKDEKKNVSSQSRNQPPMLPPLHIMTQNIPVEEQDYVDPTLFSPEVSRHAMEVAHRRAKAIANEVKEMIELDMEVCKATKAKMSPVEAVGIIGGAFASSLKRAKQLVKPGTKEYDLLSGTSPSAGMSKMNDLDTDGDGLQLSPDATQADGKLFRAPKLKPALKRISAYSTTAALESEKKTSGTRPEKKKSILWHEDVLDADEEFYNDDSDEQETISLMNGDGNATNTGNGSPRPQLLNYSNMSDGQGTSPGRKKRKKLVRSMMRRLTPREKEELYRQRPDLMIVPNWAQKYREELAGDGQSVCNAWLFGIILVLAVLLLAFILLIVRHRATTTVRG